MRTLEFDIFMFAQAAADAALTLTPDDEQLLQPVLRGRLVGTGRTDGQEAMVRRSSRHVQPQHSLGAVVEHGGRGASTAAQAAAEAACEAGRRPVVPVVRQERLQSFDSARRTAGVLPGGRVLNELLPTSAVALYAAGVIWPPYPSWLGLPARAASPYPGV